MNIIKYIAFIIVTIAVAITSVSAQDITKIRGKVVDSQTGEPLPFVDVGLLGTNVGVSSDFDGVYNIETRFPSDTVFASFLGYETSFRPIVIGETNNIDFKLVSTSQKLETVNIIEEKGKYSKKNNPAVDLSQKVINNKYTNSLKGQDYYSYDRQEKINLDLNNITDGFKNAPFIRNFEYLWDYIDTSEINGRTYLPFFMRENLSTMYYKKDGNDLKELRKASRYTKLVQSLDPQTINDGLDALYQDIDIYEDKITLLDQQFVSPFAKIGIDFYRYYIIDTTTVNGKEAINLAFIPATKGNFGFTGNIFVSNDDKYTVLKVDMGIIDGINLNFVRDLRIIQEFEPLGDAYIKTTDELIIDYSLTDNSFGMYGSRRLYFSNYSFEKPEDMSIFSSLENIVYEDEADVRTEGYWSDNRIATLAANDIELYEMVDKLQEDKRYKSYVYVTETAFTGFAKIGPVSVGPVGTFVNFNDVEGLNLRFGLESNERFSKKFFYQGFIGRAFKTDEWKYSSALTYSFNDDYRANPRHYIKLTTEKESIFPGQELDYFNPANFFLSFQRGQATNMIMSTAYEFNYVHEMNGFSYHIDSRYRNRRAYGTLEFASLDTEGNKVDLGDLNTGEVTVGIRYAPNEQFLQGKKKRSQIYNQYPIIRVDYTQAIEGLYGGDYDYSKLKINIFKQIEWLQYGKTWMILEGGKTWGDVPYILQEIPRGNQTFAYQLSSYNMMNFMEFVTDQYVSFNAEHYFYGIFLNKVPLLKKLKLRELISFKAFYGSLSDNHNPNLNPGLMQFPVDAEGNPTTFLLGDVPYMEASVGLTNIIKVFRLDLVQRLNYMDQPNMPTLFGVKGMGVRVKFHVEF